MNTVKIMFIQPNWPAPKNIKALTTTRENGVSAAPYDSFNLANDIGDDPKNVRANRDKLINTLNLTSEPVWLKQIHSNKVIDLNKNHLKDADGSYVAVKNIPSPICAITTADCLPILICNKQGTEIAALHAGWRGLFNGIIESGLSKFKSCSKDLLVWFGPAIGPNVFEVGEEVREQFIHLDENLKEAFKAKKEKYLMNIYLIAKKKLNAMGVHNIYGGDLCTYSDEKRFFSYRRNNPTGRMASLIWVAN